MRFKNLANHTIITVPTNNFPYNIRTKSSTQHTGHGLSITNREDFVRSGLLGGRGRGVLGLRTGLKAWKETLKLQVALPLIDSTLVQCVRFLSFTKDSAG
jgi:hypothetical protein